jgi:hypothetical protein
VFVGKREAVPCGTASLLVQADGTSCLSDVKPPTGVTGVIGSPTGVVTIQFCVTKTGGLILFGNGTGQATSFTADHTKLNIKPF